MTFFEGATLIGAVDGVNASFTTSTPFASAGACLYVNGVRYAPTDTAYGITVTSLTAFTVVTAPPSGSVLALQADNSATPASGIVQQGLRRTQEVRLAATNQLLNCWPEVDGVVVTPTGTPTVTIYRPGGGASLVTAATVTVDPSTQEMTYVLDASNTNIYPRDEGYRAEFSFVYGGYTYVRPREFDVCLTPLLHNCPVTPNDIKQAHAAIARAFIQVGWTTDDLVSRHVILPAWEEVCSMIEAKGFRPDLMSTPDSFYLVTYHTALRNTYRALQRAPNDNWDVMRQGAEAALKTAMANFIPRFDPSESRAGNKIRAIDQPKLLRGPDFNMQRGRSPIVWLKPTSP